MATESTLEGLHVGADHQIVYRDSDEPPTNMLGWTVVLDIRKKDTSNDPALLSKTGVVSGIYANTQAMNAQVVTFTLSDDDLAATIFKGEDPTVRGSIKRTDAGSEQPLWYGDVPMNRVTQK